MSLNQDLPLTKVQNLLAKSLGFNNWNHLSIILNNNNVVGDYIQFSITDSQKLPIKELVSQENLVGLKECFNYIYIKSCEPFAFLKSSHPNLGHELIHVLYLSSFQSILFQESIVTIISEFIFLLKEVENRQGLKLLNSEDLLNRLCSLKIEPKSLEKILKIYQFERNDFNVGLILACEHNNVEIVQYLLLNYNLDIDNFFYIGDEPIVFNPLCSAICQNSYETIHFLLNSPLLKKTANIHIEDNESLKMACRNGNLELVKFLLKDRTLKNKESIYAENCISIIFACEHDHWNIVNLLLREINFNVEPYFYEKITNRKFKFFENKEKQNRLQKIIETK